MAENENYISPDLLSLNKPERKETYYLPQLQQTVDAGEYSSERDIEIMALKKMAGKNNNAFIMGMRNLDEPVSQSLFDGYLEKKAKEQNMPGMGSSVWEATKGLGEGFAKAPIHTVGYFAATSIPLIAKTATNLYALSGAAGDVESAENFIKQANKGIDSFTKEITKITGIDDASTLEKIVGYGIGSISTGVGLGAFAGPSFFMSAAQDTYVRQIEGGASRGNALFRALWHGTGEWAIEKFQISRIYGALAKMSRPVKILKDVLENAIQEGLQQINEIGANINIDNWKTNNNWLIEKLQEVGTSIVGGAVGSLAGSTGGFILNKKTVSEVSDLMKKTGHTEEEIKKVSDSLNQIIDTDELQQAANMVANDELTTVALTYKEQAKAASEELVQNLEDTISRNELVDLGGELSGDKTVGMPPLYQLGELQIDTAKNPHLGMVLYQAEQEGQPIQTLGQVLEWTKGKLNIEESIRMNTGINAVYSKTYEQLKGFGQNDQLADANARIRSAMAFSISNKFGVSVEDADNMLGGIVQQKASEFESVAPVEVQKEVQKEVEKNVEKETESQTEQTQAQQETSLAEAVDTAVQEVAKTNKEVAESTNQTEKIEDYGEVLEGAKKNLEKTEEDTKEKKTALEKIMSKVSENRDERMVVVDWLQQQDQEFIELLAKLNRPLHAFKTPKYKNELYDLYAKHPEVKEEKPRWEVAFGNSELSKSTLDKYGIKPEYEFEIEKTKGHFVRATKENVENILGNRGKVTFTFASSTRGDYYLWVKKGSQGWKPLMKFESKEDAEKYKESHTEQELMDLYKEKSTFVQKEKPIRPRKGPDYRKGKNVTAEDFANTFGFRGVQFGNYENNEKRQRELNNAYDSLMDLATIVGIPPKAVSIEGTLGIAFGARGSGSANAHYERNNKVINITRDSGAGAIGHEWFHALDNYFGGGTNMATKSTYGRDIRFELRQKLVDFLYKIETERDFQNRLKLLGDYWKSKWEIAARVFEQYLVDKTEKSGIINDYLATEKDSGPYLTKDEQERVLPKLDEFFKTLKYEEVDGKYRLYQDVAQRINEIDEEEQSKGVPEYTAPTININGVERQTTNSDGNPIAKSEKSLRYFYDWFGDSKVVDEQGRPLVVYHATDSDFDTFDVGKIGTAHDQGFYGRGFYFSRYKGEASSYGNKVIPVYLKINNPFNLEGVDSGKYSGINNIFEKGAVLLKNLGLLDKEQLKKLDFYEKTKNEFLNKIEVFPPSENQDVWFGEVESKSGEKIIERAWESNNTKEGLIDVLWNKYTRYIKYNDETYFQNILDGLSFLDFMRDEGYRPNNFTEKLKSIGYDGVYQGDEFVVFEPNQIKSVENVGRFSKKSQNIYKQFDKVSDGVKYLKGGAGVVRGAYYNNTIYLFENANETTFLHENSHAYMDVLVRLAQDGNAQAQKDLDIIRNWLGKSSAEQFTQTDWEKFARGFEMYVREGKAPNKYLGGVGGVFDRFKSWLMDIYAGIKFLKTKNEKGKYESVKINRNIKNFYDEMLGGEDIDSIIENAQKNDQSISVLQNKLQQLSDIQQLLVEERAKIVREMAKDIKPDTTWANVKDWGKNVLESASELPKFVLESSANRLSKIDKRLGLLVQRVEQSQGLRLKAWSDQIKPFYDAFNKLSSDDKAKVQFYLLNQQWGDVSDIIGQENTESVRGMLETIYNELANSGVEVGYRENYFPRSVLDYDGLLEEMGLTYPSLRKEMESAIGQSATPQEQAEWLDKHIMSFKGNVSTRGNRNTKERKLDLITPAMSKYYKPSMETLVDYMQGMAKLLSMRDAFGKNIEYKEGNKESSEDSIGKIINNLFGENKLSKKEIDEVRQVLSALYLPNGVGNKFLQAMRQYGYATKLSYSTTIRQFADIGMMMKVNGVLNTLDALFHPDKRISLETLGIDPLGEEFQTSKKEIGGKIASISTKWKGINWADAVMKNAYLRGSYKSLQKLAETPDKFHQKYDALFGDETDTLISDLKKDNLSEPVKVLLFHEISKIQPISRSSMPTAYLSNPNGRVLYMFKTFSLHRAEYMVSEIANDFRNGDMKKAGKDIMADVAVIGWEGLVELLIAFLKYGWQAFATEAVLETFAGSGLGVLGLNKHQALQISRGQVGDFIQQMLFVGTPADDIGYMIRHYDEDDKLLRAFLPDMILEPLIVGPKDINNKSKKVK